jgi:RNA polymerase sigma-70 factor, ECF subfamily
MQHGPCSRIHFEAVRSLFTSLIRILLLMDAVIYCVENRMQHDTARLVEGLHRGDPETLDALIETYQHRLLRYLLSLTGSRPMAQDLFQETWLHVLERGRQYRSQWKFEVWLFSIARHLVIDEVRRKKGNRLQELMDPEAGGGFQPIADSPSPFDETLAGERGRRVARVLTQIPAVYREVLTLRFQDELGLEEIATIVKAPLSTVKSRLYRGLDALRRLLEVEPI